MIKDLFINGCILIAAISLGNQIFKEKEPASGNSWLKGLLAGSLGIMLMLFSVHLNNNIIIDFRNIAIIIAAVYGGPLASILSGLVIGLFRLFYFEINPASVVGLINAIILGFGCGLLAKQSIARLKIWFQITAFCLFISTLSLTLLLKSQVFNILPPYWLGTILVSSITYYYSGHLETFNNSMFKLKQAASFDFLTGLQNVREFDRLINTEMQEAKENHDYLSLITIDIDFFKKINDTYGHIEGDAVLKQLGQIIKQASRSNLVFRNGGEEFSVLLRDCSTTEAWNTAETIRQAVENQPFSLTNSQIINITISLGVACFPERVTEAEQLIEKADHALYNAKNSGRNKVVMAG